MVYQTHQTLNQKLWPNCGMSDVKPNKTGLQQSNAYRINVSQIKSIRSNIWSFKGKKTAHAKN